MLGSTYFNEMDDCFLFTVPPRVTVDNDEIPVILGDTLVLRCAAVGVPIPTITWLRNNRPLQTSDRITISDDGRELVIADAIPQDAADYQCVGRNPAGTATAVIMLWGEGGWFLYSLKELSHDLGSRDGAVVRALASHQCGPGSIPVPGVICGLSLLLVLVLAPRVFLRFSGFSPSTKTNTPNSNSTRIEDPHENLLRLMWLPL